MQKNTHRSIVFCSGYQIGNRLTDNQMIPVNNNNYTIITMKKRFIKQKKVYVKRKQINLIKATAEQ